MGLGVGGREGSGKGRRFPGKGNRKLKGPETGICHDTFFLKLSRLLVAD